MAKKINDYYDHENQVQYKPQTWQCTKCTYQIEVLSANAISHRCPKNESKATPFKKIV